MLGATAVVVDTMAATVATVAMDTNGADTMDTREACATVNNSQQEALHEDTL